MHAEIKNIKPGLESIVTELKVEDIQPVVRIANYHRVAILSGSSILIHRSLHILWFLRIHRTGPPVLSLMPGDILFIGWQSTLLIIY
jgi:hypothetical protein